MEKVVAGFLFTLFLCLVLLYLWQGKMIYYPRTYSRLSSLSIPPGVEEISYIVADSPQTSFYVPPREPGSAQSSVRLWLVFSGNASLALEWLEFVQNYPERHAGFLLIDYPGYGKCRGKPTLETIRAASVAAFSALARHFDSDNMRIEANLGVLGHSLGAAAALLFAAQHPVQRIVLVSPFTSLLDMARRTVGFPLCYLLRDRYDNRARLSDVFSRKLSPVVRILHGELDEVIPVTMSRELAQDFPRIIYDEVPGGDHNQILHTEETRIYRAMTEN